MKIQGKHNKTRWSFLLLGALLGTFLISCATKPHNVYAAHYVDTVSITTQTCPSLEKRLAYVQKQEKDLVEAQQRYAKGDRRKVAAAIVLGVFAWPFVLIAIGTKGKEGGAYDALSQNRGETAAIEKEMATRC